MSVTFTGVVRAAASKTYVTIPVRLVHEDVIKRGHLYTFVVDEVSK